MIKIESLIGPAPNPNLRNVEKITKPALESLFWSTPDLGTAVQKLTNLGFTVTESTRETEGREIFFGPDSIELLSSASKSAIFGGTFKDLIKNASTGIFAVSLESEALFLDYERLQSLFENLSSVKKASNKDGTPLWFGSALPAEATPFLRGWLVQHAPEVVRKFETADVPFRHPNTCWGIEGIHIASNSPEAAANQWAKVTGLKVEGLQWNELQRSSGSRLRPGEKFLDFIHPGASDQTAIGKITGGREGVFMLTLKVTDLEAYKNTLKLKKIPMIPCATRDGFIIPSSETGGPALRFVRTFWKKYQPIMEKGRREDYFRSLGGVYVSSLEEGY